LNEVIMSSFTEHSSIKPFWKKWINKKTFRFYHSDTRTWTYDIIPAWFVFDWCSIPICILWQRVEPETITSCCYHDWLYKTKKYSFFKSNYLFLVALRVDWVKPFKMIRYWLGVTLFWWITYYFKDYDD